MIPSLERWPTKTKEASSPHEVRLTISMSQGKVGSLGYIRYTSITHSTSTITTFSHWQGVSIPRISYGHSLQEFALVFSIPKKIKRSITEKIFNKLRQNASCFKIWFSSMLVI